MNNRQWLEHHRSVVSSLEIKQDKNGLTEAEEGILARAIAQVLELEQQISTFDDEMVEQSQTYDLTFFDW